MKKIVLILALLSALFLLNASAEERHLGEYIYMPSSQAAVSGNRYLRVEGIGFEQDGSSAVYDSLSGAQFCVYAKNADGQIKAWANPLFPTEPMRIRTAEDGATFFLPKMVNSIFSRKQLSRDLSLMQMLLSLWTVRRWLFRT